jgi:ABC-type nitrate/sulfonate/bicarbonate transport system substrate-binding protein
MDDRDGASLYEIEIGIVVPAVIYAPVWLAERRGFLRDEGLTVRLKSFGPYVMASCRSQSGLLRVALQMLWVAAISAWCPDS